jgi:hypothetical protein
LAAIAEYEAAVADLRQKIAGTSLNAAWEAGTGLDEEAAIALALEESTHHLSPIQLKST